MSKIIYNAVDEQTTNYADKYVIWLNYIHALDMKHIEYLEIGSLHGASLLAFHNMFGPNVHSTSIDPFSSCDHYSEYTNIHDKNYEIYKKNTIQLGSKNIHFKKPSHEILPSLPNDYYDVIYIDGNHNLSNILEDCTLCYRKLKQNGYMIIDDVDWGHGNENTRLTVLAFINAYTSQKMQLLYLTNDQAILKKN